MRSIRKRIKIPFICFVLGKTASEHRHTGSTFVSQPRGPKNGYDDYKPRFRSAQEPQMKDYAVANLPESSAKVNQLRLSPDGDFLYILAADCRAIWRRDVKILGDGQAKLELVLVTSHAPESLKSHSKLLPSPVEFPINNFWVDNSGGLIFADQNGYRRISPDFSGVLAMSCSPAALLPRNTRINVNTQNRAFYIHERKIMELKPDGNSMSVEEVGSCQSDLDPWRPHLAFQVGHDNSIYTFDKYQILKQERGSSEAVPIVGTGLEPQDGVNQRRSGLPLLADIGYYTVWTVDSKGNILFIHHTFNGCDDRYTNLQQYLDKANNRFVTICLGKELIKKDGWVPDWFEGVVLDEKRNRYFVALLEKTVWAVEFSIPAPDDPPVQISRIFTQNPSLGDFDLPGSTLKLHRAVLAVRAPKLLDISQISFPPGIIDALVSYIYDDKLPSDMDPASSPTIWLDLFEAAESFGIASLRSRCLESFHRHMLYTSPDFCISGALATAQRNPASPLLDLAVEMILGRPQIMTPERAKLLEQRPVILSRLAQRHSEVVLQRVISRIVQQGPFFKIPPSNSNSLPLGANFSSLLSDPTLSAQFPADMTLFGAACHRVIMESRCPFVRNWFAVAPDEANIPSLDADFSPEAVQATIRYLYSLELNNSMIPNSAVKQVMEVARQLDLHQFASLFDHCQQVIAAEEEAKASVKSAAQSPFGNVQSLMMRDSTFGSTYSWPTVSSNPPDFPPGFSPASNSSTQPPPSGGFGKMRARDLVQLKNAPVSDDISPRAQAPTPAKFTFGESPSPFATAAFSFGASPTQSKPFSDDKQL